MSNRTSPPPALRILIVDDHTLMCEGLRLMLAKYPGAEVVGICGDTVEGFRLAGTLRPDLVLMDVDLPDGSGIELTKRIRETYAGIKVLVLTAHLERKFATAAIEAGASGYLVKTNAISELMDAVRTVAAGGFHLSGGLREATGPVADGSTRALPLREGQVLACLLRGLRNKEIAAELELSVKTVETYRARLMKRFGCNSMAELVIHAIREGHAAPGAM